jgi:phosphatidylglycerol lysyltransferase
MALSDANGDDGASRASTRRVTLTAVYLLHWVVAAPAALVCVALRRSPVAFARTSDRRLIRHEIPAAGGATESRDETAEIMRRHGSGALLPYQFGADKSRLKTAEGSVVVWARYGRFAVALGDPIGPAGSTAGAWRAFVADRRASGDIPAVYQASDESLAGLRKIGLRPFRIGQEAIIDLASFSLSGSRRANLRHTITRARKGGTDFRFYPGGIPEPESASLGRALGAIDAVWAATAGPRLGFTIGQFDPAELGELAVAVASDPEGRPIAFTTYRPTGIDGGWVLDLLRRHPDGAPGALEGSIAEAAFGLHEAGAPTLSLGLAPLSGLTDASAVREERTLAMAASVVRPVYDVNGLAFFKRKFDPRWEPRYIAIAKRTDLPGLALALVGLHVDGIRSVARGWLGGAGRRGMARTSRLLRDRLHAVMR